MEAEILQQLLWIKWLLAACVVLVALFVLILAGFFVYLSLQVRRNLPDLTKSWREMLDQGKAKEVVTLTRERLTVAPHDAEAHWCLAQAYSRTGDFWRALSTARQLQRLAPEWERHTTPLIAAMERQLATLGSNPEQGNDDLGPEHE